MRQRVAHLIVVCSAAFLPAALWAQQLDAPTVKGNVSIQVPHGWAAAAANRALIAVRAPQPDTDQTGQFQASLSVTQDAGNQINATAQEKVLAQQTPSYRSVEQPRAMVVNGVNGVYFGGTFTNNNSQLRTRLYMFSVNNQIYIVTFTCLASQWAHYEPALQASVGSLTLKR